MADEREIIQCTACKKRFFEDGFKTNRLGRRLKTCLECNARDEIKRKARKCEHGRRRTNCKPCGGTCICEHGRVRYNCKPCGGTCICEHGRVRYSCKLCGGGHVKCEHGCRRSLCKLCGGGSICEHGCRRSLCKPCGGGSICGHGHKRDLCKNCDPAGHLRSVVTKRVYSVLKSNKDHHTLEYLGCDIKTFRAHIEAQFTDGMTWDNHGQGEGMWNIDHIIPIKYPGEAGGAPTLEEVAARLHYTNTQPMWASENIVKGNRYVGRAGQAGGVLEPAAEPEKPPLLTDDELTEALAEFGF